MDSRTEFRFSVLYGRYFSYYLSDPYITLFIENNHLRIIHVDLKSKKFIFLYWSILMNGMNISELLKHQTRMGEHWVISSLMYSK